MNLFAIPTFDGEIIYVKKNSPIFCAEMIFWYLIMLIIICKNGISPPHFIGEQKYTFMWKPIALDLWILVAHVRVNKGEDPTLEKVSLQYSVCISSLELEQTWNQRGSRGASKFSFFLNSKKRKAAHLMIFLKFSIKKKKKQFLQNL